MIPYAIGFTIGLFVGFVACALFSINSQNDAYAQGLEEGKRRATLADDSKRLYQYRAEN